MKELRVSLRDETVAALERKATQLGRLDVSDFLSAEIERRLSDFISQAIPTWMPQERWAALVRGEGCSICRLLQVEGDENDEGYKICNLRFSRLQLMKNQFVPGYCVMSCLKHVREPYELDSEEQKMFFSDLMQAGLALEKVFMPSKMNFEILGNGVPHLHCHIKPRFHCDQAPGVPIDQNAYYVPLTPEQYLDRIKLIRAAL